MRYNFLWIFGLVGQAAVFIVQIGSSLLRPLIKRRAIAQLVTQGWSPSGARLYTSLGSMMTSMRFIQATLVAAGVTCALFLVWAIANWIAEELQ